MKNGKADCAYNLHMLTIKLGTLDVKPQTVLNVNIKQPWEKSGVWA
jgi:hypothetical protein